MSNGGGGNNPVGGMAGSRGGASPAGGTSGTGEDDAGTGGESGDSMGAGRGGAAGSRGGSSPNGGTPGTDGDDAGAGGESGSGDGAGEGGGAGAAPASRVRLATFNIQNFGQTKLGRPDVMEQLVGIVRAYPFVAVQEISDVNEVVPYALLDEINTEGGAYEMLLSPRSGQQADDQNFEEQYGFYYDREVVEPLSAGSLYDDSLNDWFVREPYLARFRVVGGGFTFVAVTVHTQPDNAVAEIGHLHDVVQSARAQFPEEDDFIVLGDLNAGCSYASPTELDALPIRGDGYAWVVPDDADTNLASARCAYDRIVVTKDPAPNYVGTYGVDVSFVDTRISDHWPVWAEFWADERPR